MGRTKGRSCAGKRAHSRREFAERQLRGLVDERAARDLEVYLCGFCGRWHVGHRRPSGRRRAS
jgi:hypothetical protein